MAILQEDQVTMSSHTFEKTIDPTAIQLMQNILQISQYNYPQRSSMRELVSNGVDSIEEKIVAMSILKGKARVEDHYLERTEGIYKDSRFDPAYYDLKWLSPHNLVEVEYHNNGNLERDKILVRDHGVGLWGARLAGYFNLGYSTKRNSKFALGKFGIGAKSALSTGAPFFTMTTRHNGRMTSFNVYSSHIEPATPSIDLLRGVANTPFELPTSDPTKPMICYWTPTEEKNGVTLEVQVKKHHKALYLDGIRMQLMYFNYVKLYDITNGQKNIIDFKPTILFENAFMVISENALYNKPHLVIDKVNYGDINFKELELDPKNGNVGLKVRAEEVTVNPSRESVVWDDMTKQAILNVYKRMVATASELIEKELNQDKFWPWVRACTQAANSSYGGTNNILAALGSFVDFAKVAPRFSGRPELSAGVWILSATGWTNIMTIVETKGSKKIKKLKREPVLLRVELLNRPIVRRRGASSARKNKYLSSVVHPNGYIEVVIPYKSEDERYARNFGNLDYEEFVKMIYKYRKVQRTEDATRSSDLLSYKATDEDRQAVQDALQFVYQSLDEEPSFMDYDDVIVPAEFKATEEETEEEEIVEEAPAAKVKYRNMSAADRRKLQGTIPIYGLSANSTKIQYEVKPKSVDNWAIDEVYVATFNDMPLLMLATQVTSAYQGTRRYVTEEGISRAYLRDRTPKLLESSDKYEVNLEARRFFNPHIRLMLVGEKYHRYFEDFQDIQTFFKDIKQGTITMSKQLKQFNTARLIKARMDAMEYLIMFSGVNPDIQKKYAELTSYVHKNYKTSVDNEELLSYLAKVSNLQLFVRDNPNQHEAITAMVATMFGDPGDVNNADAIDLPVYDAVNTLWDLLQPVHGILQYFDWDRHEPNAEFTQEVRQLIHERNANILFTYKPVQ